MSSYELAWAAGFYDGEGCTCMNRKGSNRTVRLAVMQKDPRPLDRFMRAVGNRGQIYELPKINSWACTSEPVAREVLDLLWPYLSEPKREQAERCFADSTWHDGHHNLMLCADPSHVVVPRKSGGRRCKTCQSAYHREWRRRRKGASA